LAYSATVILQYCMTGDCDTTWCFQPYSLSWPR